MRGCVIQLLALLAAWLPVVAQAQFLYSFNNGAITITGYTGTGGVVTIPDRINGLTVTSIGDFAFYGRTGVTNVTIPNTVTNIGIVAFRYCTGLESITIPNSVSSIGGNAFSACTSLTAIVVDADNSVYSSEDGVLFDKNRKMLIRCPGGKTGSCVIPNGASAIMGYAFDGCARLTSIITVNSVTNIGVFAFQDCRRLTNVTIADNITSIGGWAFFGCTSLTSITLPDAVTSIGEGAFRDCTSLTGVTIPDRVTSINDFMFYGCTGLASIGIGSAVRSIGTQVFSDCVSLAKIGVEDDNSTYSSIDGVLFDKSRTTLIRHPAGRSGTYAIPGSVTNIWELAFERCVSLTSVTIPNGVLSIGAGAFYGCTGLTNVTVPGGVTIVWDVAFAYCGGLNGVYFQGEAPLVAPDAFEGNDAATIYYLPGTTGWGPTFGGRPTALWLPQVSTGDAGFGVRTNRFGFNIHWASGRTVVVEACEGLANPVWTPVGTNTLAEGSSYFSDPHWSDSPARFYRLREW